MSLPIVKPGHTSSSALGQESGQEWGGKCATLCYLWTKKCRIFRGFCRGKGFSKSEGCWFKSNREHSEKTLAAIALARRDLKPISATRCTLAKGWKAHSEAITRHDALVKEQVRLDQVHGH